MMCNVSIALNSNKKQQEIVKKIKHWLCFSPFPTPLSNPVVNSFLFRYFLSSVLPCFFPPGTPAQFSESQAPGFRPLQSPAPARKQAVPRLPPLKKKLTPDLDLLTKVTRLLHGRPMTASKWTCAKMLYVPTGHNTMVEFLGA